MDLNVLARFCNFAPESLISRIRVSVELDELVQDLFFFSIGAKAELPEWCRRPIPWKGQAVTNWPE